MFQPSVFLSVSNAAAVRIKLCEEYRVCIHSFVFVRNKKKKSEKSASFIILHLRRKKITVRFHEQKLIQLAAKHNIITLLYITLQHIMPLECRLR